MPVGEQIAILYCGTKGLLRDIEVDKVRQFEELFLELLRSKHQKDVLDQLSHGKIDDSISGILESVASQVKV